MSLQPVSVVIPSYMGVKMLGEYLPAVKGELEEYPGKGELIVVDDGSTDGSFEWLKENHPSVKSVAMKQNMGFQAACNRGIGEAANEVVILLNNDMAPMANCFESLVKRLTSNDDIFAVTAKSITQEGGNESVSRAEMDDGLILLRQPGLKSDESFDRPITIFHSAGGFSAYRRERFLELGGFDTVFHPIYWEDVDLSFRAWKRGWWSVYEPQAVIRHRSHGTMEKIQSREKYDMLHHTNLHLFHMVNLEMPDLMRYLKRVNRLMSEINLYDNGVIRRGFFQALKKAGEVLERRAKLEKGKSVEQIIEMSSNKPLEGA